MNQLPHNFIEPACSVEQYVVPERITAESSLADILAFARKQQASDVHISPNTPIAFRKFTKLLTIDPAPISLDQIHHLLKGGIPLEMLNTIEANGDAEFVLTVPGSGRFRMTIIRQRFGIDITARIIPNQIMSFQEAQIPVACENLTHWTQGLVLIAGPSGCGKTTTLAAMVDMINQTRQDHIITIEQPIEYIFDQAKCQISQREIKKHTLTQASSLRAALREDPDIIVVSELRDLETIQLAVTAAETGHLVLGTMNTNDAVQTISKLIFSFPADERTIITNMISESLRGVVCQQLIPNIKEDGVVPAFEILMVNTAVAHIIRENKFQQIYNTITSGKSLGMVLMDHALEKLVTSKQISAAEAYKRALNPKAIEPYLS